MSEDATTPRLSIHQLSLYNTGRMSSEQVIAAFAARRQQFERIVADIAAEKPKSRAQHHLIVGQRGMGKTLLLARIAAELRKDAKLAARFIPLVFAEEQYAVDRLSKFWLNCLDSLADARELANDMACVDVIDATVKRLSAGPRDARNDQAFADEVYEAFAQITKATGQRPVLLVDNLQLVFERIGERQQHSLRELLMRPGSPILVGASPSPPPQSQDYGAAFYDQFKVHYLRPLDESEMRALLLHLAEVAQRDDVRQRVLQHPARLTVLRQLTGGNPRTVLTLFFLYAEDFSPSVFGDLEGLLDRVTPLYKARFEELTEQQQVVASAVANHWDPVTGADLATATGLPPGTISAQLDRLEKTGLIERTELFGETRTGYQLAERFFNIWFLMRAASRRQRREVEFLTRFLESFYEPADRTRLATHLMTEDHFSPDRYIWTRAVAASLEEPATAEELTRHAELAALREDAREARSRLRELIDFDSLPPATLAFDDLRRKLMSLVPDGAAVSPEDFATAVLGDQALFRSGEREKLAARGGKLTQKQIKSVLTTIRKSQAALKKTFSVEAVEWFSQRLARGQIRALHDVEDWQRAFNQVSEQETIRLMVVALPAGLGATFSDSTLTRIRAALEPSASTHSLLLWAVFLHSRFERYGEAETAYRQVLKADSTYPIAVTPLGILLEGQKRYAEAEAAYREALARRPNDPHFLTSLGDLLKDHLQRYSEAEALYLSAIGHRPTADSWNALGDLYLDYLDRLSDAAAAYDNALRLEPSDEVAHQNRLFLHRDFLGEGSNALPLFDTLRALPTRQPQDTIHLHAAIFAAYDSNWGVAGQALDTALTVRANGFSLETTDDWIVTSAVLLHLNLGAELLALLDRRGDTARLRPWVEAVRALHIGDRRALQNVAPEIRTSAEVFYDRIERRLNRLPAKTRRRPLPKAKQTRSRRRRAG